MGKRERSRSKEKKARPFVRSLVQKKEKKRGSREKALRAGFLDAFPYEPRMWSFLGLSGPSPGALARSALPSSPPPVPVPNGDNGSVVVDASMMSLGGDRGGGASGGFRVSLPTHGTVVLGVKNRARGRSERSGFDRTCRARHRSRFVVV